MRSFLSVSAVLLFTFFCSLAHAIEKARTVDVFAWPLSESRAQTLASISYTSTNATLKTYNAPAIPAGDDVLRVGFYHPSGSWSGVATSASSFAPGAQKKILLHLNTAGELYHVGFRATDIPSSGTGKASTKKDEGVSVEIVAMQKGSAPILSKPVVVNEQGQETKEVEKSFIQKYWWVIAAFFVVQLIMGGGAKE